MVDLSTISGPTHQQGLRAYRFHRGQQLPLYHSQLDGQPGLRPKQTTRLVEGDLVPVTDRAGQQLAKRCSDLHDQFLASATVDNKNNNNGAKNSSAGNNKASTHGGGMGGNEGANNSATININNNTVSGSNHPEPNPPANPAGANNNNPQTTLHIPLQDYLEFTTLFHRLTTPQAPTPQQQREELTALHANLRQTTHRLQQQATLLADHEAALAQREAAVTQREATASLLYDDALLTKQLTDVWQQGFEHGRQQQAWHNGGGRQVENSHGRPVVNKGKGRMAMAARGQDGDVEMIGGLVAEPKGKGQMVAPSTPVRVEQGTADIAAAQGQDDVDMDAWLNMDELAEGDRRGA